ncbi:hypothetical protein DBR06_SOUSAS4210063, partial [Sousa chinensis]
LTGMGTGSAGLLNSIFTARQLSLELTQETANLAAQINMLQEQINSLAGVVLQNRRALDLLTANQGGTCAMLKEDCCFLVNQSGKVQTQLRAIIERAKWILQGVSGEFDWWDFKTNIWSWFSWLTPFLGPIVAFLLLLIFGPCIFNLLVKFVSSRIQQINLHMVMQQEYQPVNTRTTLE